MTIWRSDMADDSIDLARDVALVRMRRRGLPWRRIGKFLGAAESTLRSKYESLPPEVREAYARTPLDDLGL